jgi:hypothetical protein
MLPLQVFKFPFKTFRNSFLHFQLRQKLIHISQFCFKGIDLVHFLVFIAGYLPQLDLQRAHTLVPHLNLLVEVAVYLQHPLILFLKQGQPRSQGLI